MYWEQISFCVLLVAYIMLSSVTTINRQIHHLRQKRIIKNLLKMNYSLEDFIRQIAASGIILKDSSGHEEKFEPYHGKAHLSKYIKVVINYCVAFNSSFLIVGTLAESYLFGVRLTGNIIAIILGFIYAVIIVHPFTYSLDEDIKNPFDYFKQRYGNKNYVGALTAAAAMLFYFLFLTLYLYGCAILTSTIIPEIPLWVSTLIFGAYSMLGSIIGGFTQSTKTNVVQFCLMLTGLIMTFVFTIQRHPKWTAEKMWKIASENNRMNFFNTNFDFSTKYTIINQCLSLSIPWTYIHSLFLPNFIRYRHIPGKNRSRFLVISNFPFMLLVNLILVISGGVLCYIYFYGCDPIVTGKLRNKNQIGTYWMYLVLSKNAPSFTGILFASIIGYSIVQHSMGMALLGKIVFREVIKPFFNFSDIAKKYIKYCITLSFGILSTALCIGFRQVKITVLSLFFVFNNSINSPILGLFFLSAFNPYANHIGAMLALVINLVINIWLSLGLVLFSRFKSQEFESDIFLCNESYHTNMTILNVYNFKRDITINKPSHMVNDLYPKEPVLAFLYSIASIWYCLFSFVFMILFGSIFSLIYSLIKTRSFDADRNFSETRKSYLYIYRVFKMRKKSHSSEAEEVTHL